MFPIYKNLIRVHDANLSPKYELCVRGPTFYIVGNVCTHINHKMTFDEDSTTCLRATNNYYRRRYRYECN